ncbi:MAG: M18 family aminopeptidase [Ruminiclostridium sp.]|nr:M18 family aminopeptidase [Ruminiclostridium sp.]
MSEIKNLQNFLDNSHSSYHAVANLAAQLQEAGYTRLSEKEEWDLVPGGKYFLVRGGTAVIAFRIPEGEATGFMMSASHSDRPTFKVKENCETVGAYTKMLVERYGGMLISTWLDRPLSIAGRVVVETEDGVEIKLVDIDRDLLMIPNVAIHMNRQANDGYKWNPAVDTLPLMGGKDAKGKLNQILEEAAGGKILGHDMYLYIRQKSSIWGLNEEYISSAALDDLECAWACTQGFLAAPETAAIPVLCVFDNEEVGSSSAAGAAGDLLESVLVRICEARELDIFRLLANSFMVSADNGHALHPNHPELADAANAPVLGGGVVLKFNASQRYCTDGFSAAVFRRICGKAEVPTQTYCNRADIAGGSTLGNISLHHVSVPTIDIGVAQLAMHSCFETGSVADAIHLKNALAAFYGATLNTQGDACVIL